MSHPFVHSVAFSPIHLLASKHIHSLAHYPGSLISQLNGLFTLPWTPGSGWGHATGESVCGRPRRLGRRREDVGVATQAAAYTLHPRPPHGTPGYEHPRQRRHVSSAHTGTSCLEIRAH